MTKAKLLKTEFEPGRGYEKADWDAVESPALTDEELAQAKPFAEVFPALAENLRKSGRPRSDKPRRPISLRVDPDVLDYFKAAGPGWQSRMHDVLAKEAGKR